MATFTSVVSSPAFKTEMLLTCSLRPQHSTFLHHKTRLISDSAKSLEWKKAGDFLKQQSLSYGRKTFVLLFVAWFGFSFFSDAVYSVSVNKELLMPLGLFAGCLFTEFAKETSLEFFQLSEVTDLGWNLAGVGCFCILIKLLSLGLPVQGRVFLLHVANGGLLQVLWLWQSSLKATLFIH